MSTAPSSRRLAGALLDQAREPLRERHAARLDADERDLVEARVRLDDLVRDPRERPRERVGVEEELPGCLDRAHGAAGVDGPGTCVIVSLLSGLTGPG